MGNEIHTAFHQANKLASSELVTLRRVVQKGTTALMQENKPDPAKIKTTKTPPSKKLG